MRFLLKQTIYIVATAFLLLFSSLSLAQADYPTYPKIDYGTGDQAKLAKRGEYLAQVGDCISCHTVTPGGKVFAGDLPIKTPFGTFYTPNITPDKKNGIGNWKFKDFKRAMHDGKNPKGANYFPVFPYVYFNKVSDNDLRALWAYLQKLPAVNKKPRKNAVPFPFNVRFAQYGWKILFFYPRDEPFKYDASKSKQWNRGRYLVDGLGHCSMCHTPMNFLGGEKRKNYLSGGFVDGFWATNITGQGLEEADRYQVADVFKEYKLLNNAGTVVGPMAEVVHNSLSHITEADKLAIADYLKTVKSVDPMGLTPSKARPTLARGRLVYQRACVVCHQNGEEGAPVIGDSAGWFMRAKKGMPTLYQHAIYGYNLMPIKGACVTCSYEDIESAVDYLLEKSLTHAQKLQLAEGKVKIEKPKVSGATIYKRSCASCHNDGEHGAPKIGDHRVWSTLINKNMDVLIANAVTGHHGGILNLSCRHCQTTDVIAAIKYILKQSKVKGDYVLW